MDTVDSRLLDINDCLYRVTNKAVILHDAKLLVVEESEGWYGLPGGGLDYGETTNAALARELHEEVGLLPEDIEIVPGPIFVSNEGIVNKVPRFTLYYRVKLKSNNVRANELSYKWISPKELSTLRLSPTLVYAREFLRSIA